MLRAPPPSPKLEDEVKIQIEPVLVLDPTLHEFIDSFEDLPYEKDPAEAFFDCPGPITVNDLNGDQDWLRLGEILPLIHI